MLGYFLASLIGLSLGLLGGGGSILTVPILVYVLKMDPKVSIALSLAIVGTTSLFGVIRHYKNNNVNFKIALIFAPVAMIGTFMGAKISQMISGQTQLILFVSISILSWCLILAFSPLNIRLIAYCSSRPELSCVSTKNKDRN